jgi:predicted extracellular nuclease
MHHLPPNIRRQAFTFALILALLLSSLTITLTAQANSNPQPIPFTQDWSDTNLITSDDDWSGVPGIIGYRGDGLTSANDVDPQTVLADGSSTPVDVNANRNNPDTFTTGGVTEFEIANPAVALQGSGTADAPHIVLYLNTLGESNIAISYNLRDIDGSADNAVQQVALQYRLGSVGDFTNLPAGYVADATSGPNEATQVTPVNVMLPAEANDQPEVQVRIITTNASGSDEWVAIDDLQVVSGVSDLAPSVSSTIPGDGDTNVPVDSNLTVNFSEPVDVTGAWFDLTCDSSGAHSAAVSGGPVSFTLDPDADFAAGESCTGTIFAAQVSDQDTDDPPDNMAADYSFSFTTAFPPPPVTLVINEILADPDSLLGDANGDGVVNTSDDEFVEIVNAGAADVNLGSWTLSDGVSVRHTFPANTLLHPSCAIVIFAGGTPTGAFGGSLVQTTTSGALGLNNTGDTVTLSDVNQTPVVAYTYGSEGGNNTSLTRDPDVTGPDPLVEHNSVPEANGALFSPGTQLDGTPFPGGCSQPVAIHDIQGAGHKSPLLGQAVRDVPGVVTALTSNGFFLQDPNPDADEATSEGIFVFTGSAPGVALGDALLVAGNVAEYYPGGFSTGNLSTTEIDNPVITILSSGNPLPPATVIGLGGRLPPATVIEDDASGDVETTGVFDPASDGIDFYESLEGMRVQVNDAVAVGPTNDYGEIPVVGDNGANASLRTPRGGLVIQADDFNPERIILDDAILPVPAVNVGDGFTGPVAGVLDYDFGNYKLLITDPLTPVPAGLGTETALPADADQLSVASFNVENLDPGDDPARFAGLAERIVDGLASPDILALEEVQDNNGATDDGVVDASLTYQTLVAAIQTAGGPAYDFRDIAPVNDQDGGEPGGNIRVGFLFRTDRGLAFIDHPGATATTPNSVSLGTNGVELAYSPGRIDPTNSAFFDSRKPLAAEFEFYGHKVIVIANHFNSKGGDDPLFGRIQPPMLASEAQRIQQAQIVHDFIADILALDPAADVIVLGDLNDFQFSPPLITLAGDLLTNLVTTLPPAEQYTYIYDGNSQVLDNLLVSEGLLANADVQFDIVHGDAEFISAQRPSDHDPILGRFRFAIDTTPPVTSAQLAGTPGANGWFWSDVTVTLTATDNGGSGVALTEYSLDGGANWQAYADPFVLSGEGVTGVLFRSTDNAGNQEADQSLAVQIDRQAPEGQLAFDPLTLHIVLTGSDEVSGVSEISPPALAAGSYTYTITDLAGHSLELTIADTRLDASETVSIASLVYDGGSPITPPANSLSARWNFRRNLHNLQQTLNAAGEFWARSVWNVITDLSVITSRRLPDPATVRFLTGLVPLQLFTNQGALDFAP